MAITPEERENLLSFQPTHVMTADGLVKVDKPPDPSEETWKFFDESPELVTGIQWTGMQMAGRIAIMAAWGSPAQNAISQDVMDIFPAETREYIAFWQRQINNGSCWNTSGFIGRQANELIHQGFCLLGPEPTKNFYGSLEPSRHQVDPGTPGSPLYVKTMMSQAYLDWLETIT